MSSFGNTVQVLLLCSHRLLQCLLPLLLVFGSAAASAQLAEGVDIPFSRFELDNGLTLIVHEDNKAPIVAVNIWYHVGSKDEEPGITGFAHLFEHLMFNGSENYNDEWFLPLQKAGGTDLNGTTWFDRTNYFQSVPVPALDMVLWMESDRMGHFLGAVTQERLDEQREVVKNEKRQGDNRPYGKAGYLQLEGMFPEGHPYRWSTIGSMDDLNAASVDDVKDWFRRYYGAANAVLVVAGDVDPQTVFEKVKLYFGDIPSGPALSKRERWVAKRNESSRDVMFDKVPQARLTRAWNTPPFGDIEDLQLKLAAAVLGQGKNSRLYKRLVYEEQLATSVSASQTGFEIAGIFEVEAYLKPGVAMADVEAIIEQELRRFIKDGPTRDELKRVKTRIFASQLRGLEKVGGFSGKAQTLARYQTYLGDAGLFRRDLQRLEEASGKDIRRSAAKWLSSGDYNLEVYPQPEYRVASEGADRSALPDPGPAPTLVLPDPVERRLGNGLRVLTVDRGQLPITHMAMVFDGGYASDAPEQLGLAAITATMLDEGTQNLDALAIARRAEELGAVISANASLDSTTVSLSALNANLSPSVSLYADVIRRPAFAEPELARIKSNWKDRIAQENSSPFSIALRRLPPLLYGEGHRYGIPFTGSGFVETVERIDTDALRAKHASTIRPGNATLVVVGPIDWQALKPVLERYFGDWRDSTDAVAIDSSDADAPPAEPAIYLIDKPEAPQSLILGGQLAPPSAWADGHKLEMAVDILGGSFTSRVNMNLREDKGWAYGARVMLPDALGQRPMLYYAPVQSDKTVPALMELKREAREFGGERPASDEELQRFKSAFERALPGNFETNGALLSALLSIVELGRPLDYLQQNQARVASLTVDDVSEAVQAQLQLDQTIWLVVGDLATIEAPLREYADAVGVPLVVLEPGGD